MAIRSSILAWRIPWTEEPGRLQSIGHKESDMTEVTEHAHTGRKDGLARLEISWAFSPPGFKSQSRRLLVFNYIFLISIKILVKLIFIALLVYLN